MTPPPTGWKKKNKELSPEEAIKQATEAAVPFWLKSTPLFTAVPDGEQFVLRALDQQFSKQLWVLLILDPSDVSYQVVIWYLKELLDRYQTFEVQVCLVVTSSLKTYLEKQRVEDFIVANKILTPVVIDHDRKISKALDVKSLTKALFIQGKEVYFSGEDEEWMQGLELSIHDILRKKDPGLPLFSPYAPAVPIPNEKIRILFKRDTFDDVFLPLDDQWVKNTSPFTNLDIMEGKIGIYGKWDYRKNHIKTKDPEAKLIFVSSMANFCLIGQSLSEFVEPSRAMIEINERPVLDIFAGQDLNYDEDGQSYAPIRESKLYFPVSELDDRSRNVVISFPTADKIPIALHGIQFYTMKVFDPDHP